MNKTSIIIPTYNGEGLLRECLQAIRSYTSPPYEILVIDNGSIDGTLDFCRDEDVILVSAASRLGFPRACNYGLQLASGDVLVLLNNDVLVTPRWLENMQRCLYSDEKVGIVGPLTNYASGEQQVHVTYQNLHDFADEFNQPDSSKWREIERIVGLCMAFKRELMLKIGLLDEQFSPGHYEDDDFCYRAQIAGYRLLIAGDVFVHHHGSASFGREDPSYVKQLISRNRQRFIEKWGVEPKASI